MVCGHTIMRYWYLFVFFCLRTPNRVKARTPPPRLVRGERKEYTNHNGWGMSLKMSVELMNVLRDFIAYLNNEEWVIHAFLKNNKLAINTKTMVQQIANFLWESDSIKNELLGYQSNHEIYKRKDPCHPFRSASFETRQYKKCF